MFCHYCGKQIEEDSKFCPFCGKKTIKNGQIDRGRGKSKPKKKRLGCLFTILILLIVLSGGAFFVYRSISGIEIEIDKATLRYDEDLSCYCLSSGFNGFHGTVLGNSFIVKQLTYEISDVYGTCISSGDLSLQDQSWSIENPGMLEGVNTLTVTAATYLKTEVVHEIRVVNTDPGYFMQATVDISDSDDDGIINYLEGCYGTAADKADTDGDGLSDYIEIAMTATDPTLYSTMDDGICDADRDSDRDGLLNLNEVALGTDAGSPDTDGDGLVDGEEVLVYKTDPLSADSDMDHATDGWEIEHGYDPLVYDESFEVTANSASEGSAVAASVILSCRSNPESLSVEPVQISGLLDESMAGYLGSAYSFYYGGEFSEATITMTFDASLLENGVEPAIFYFDEDAQTLQELDTTIDGNTASAVVSHFSTYILLDRIQASRIIEEDIFTPDEVDQNTVNIAFVVDYSSSMDTNDPEYIRIAIVQEYIGKLREDKDAAALIQFAGYATTLVPLCSDMEMLANAADSITNTGSDTCSYDDAGTNGTDGLRHALDELETSDDATNQYIIFLTDGEDTTSSYDYEELTAEAVDHHIVIYTVGMGSCDSELLQKIADSTGGKFHYASTADYDTDGTLSLKDIFAEIEEETVDYYADSNEDGISDYYTRLICDGLLTTGTGANPFAGASYDDIQSEGSDYDHDGLKNGEEIIIRTSDDMVYLQYCSSPVSADTDMDGEPDGTDNRRLLWDVGDRDLALFSALAYEDGSQYVGKMYTAESIYGNDDERGERYYFLDFASIDEGGVDASISDRWILVNYVNLPSTVDFFSASTFKCQDNIVIAFRGTNELLEWVDNVFCYGMCNFHSEEIYARSYAKNIAAAYPNCKIYITGHSLGGYLAQIGAAELLENTGTVPERVSYFNGIGINFQDHTGITELFKSTKIKLTSESNKLLHLIDMYALQEYSESGDSPLISYEICGDIVSALGTHCGKEIAFDATEQSRKHHSGKYKGGDLSQWAGSVLAEFAGRITAKKISYYYNNQYKSQSIKEYMWLTHETDSFFFYLKQGTRTGNP